jgi:hypothetical protein
MNDIRFLRADEIDVRVQSITESKKNGAPFVGAVLVLYKDARADMTLLDETFGLFGWQRKHTHINGNLFCEVSVKNPETGEWVIKQDVGTESNIDKEKGEASDSFKRACVNIGIGRELYTAPFMWVELKEGEYYLDGGKYKADKKLKFSVDSIGYNNGLREICAISIIDNKGIERYRKRANSIAAQVTPQATPEDAEPPETRPCCADCGGIIAGTEKTPVSVIVGKTLDKYGRALCLHCAKKAKEA